MVPAVQRGDRGVGCSLQLWQSPSRIQWSTPEQDHVPDGPSERFTDEAVEEEVDGRVQHGHHVGQIVRQVDAPVPVNGGHVQMVDDHHGSGGPEHREDRGDGQEHCRGFSKSVPSLL